MPLYVFHALDARNRRTHGTLEVASHRIVRRTLSGRGLRLTYIQEKTIGSHDFRAKLPGWAAWFVAKVGGERLLESLENLTTMLKSGVTLEKSCANLTSQALAISSFSNPLRHLHEAVCQGQSLSDSMSSLPRCFDAIDVALVRAGEDAGELSAAIERLVERKRLAGKMTGTCLAAVA